MKSKVIVPIVVASLWITCLAAAESGSVLSSARELAKQGLQAYDSGRYEEAADKLGRAYQVVHVPTLAVGQARSLVKLGRWVAASELYLEATRIAPEKSWQSTQADAQRDAERERGELLPRIPRLTVAVKGVAATSDVTVTVDGATLPPALVGTEQLQDPGVHKVQGTHGNEVVTENISVKEGDRANVTLQFKLVSAAVIQSAPSPANPPATVPAPVAAQPAAPAPTSTAVTSTGSNPTSNSGHPGNTQRVVGWVGIGLGGAGLIAGGITGLLAVSKKSTLSDSGDCSADLKHCTAAHSGDVDSYNSLRTISTIGLYAGGILAAAGVTLLLTSPKQETGPQMSLLLAPNSVGVAGGF
jgi:hypothetical protein